MERERFVCACFSPEHQFDFVYDPEDLDELYLEVHLNQYRSFWARLWGGLKYAFGYTSKYGHWDSVIIDKEGAERIHDLMVDFLNNGSSENEGEQEASN